VVDAIFALNADERVVCYIDDEAMMGEILVQVNV
jgi:hypothetical protein